MRRRILLSLIVLCAFSPELLAQATPADTMPRTRPARICSVC